MTKKNSNLGRRLIGIFLIVLSVSGIILFNIKGWKNIDLFYITGGWGLGMLI